MNNPKIAAVVPALNETLSIQQVVRELRSLVDVVIVVDDGSNDSTAANAEVQGAVVLQHTGTRGYGAALKTGIAHALASQADMAVLVDGDGAHDPAAIPRLVRQHLTSGADLTLGSRLIDGPVSRFPSPKESVNRLAAAIFRKVTGVPVSDVACGMRLLGRKAMSLPVKQDDFGYSFQLLMEAMSQGLKMAEAPVAVRYDASEALVSRTCEIIAFLTVLSSLDAAGRFQTQIVSIVEAVTAFRLVTVAAGDSYYYLHPVSHLDAFLVQEQHQVFYPRDAALGAMISF